jgi:membrane associated rhomboid family serine protease
MNMLAALFSQMFRWARVWGLCGVIIAIVDAFTRSDTSDPATLWFNIILTVLIFVFIVAVYGALAALGYTILTALDSSPGSRTPIGMLAGGVSGFACMRITLHIVAAPLEGAVAGLLAGTLLGYFLAKTARPANVT